MAGAYADRTACPAKAGGLEPVPTLAVGMPVQHSNQLSLFETCLIYFLDSINWRRSPDLCLIIT
jgi:hypothetical protein